jgi:peptidoglycan/LPS O-acetylase OafA/YrhL
LSTFGTRPALYTRSFQFHRKMSERTFIYQMIGNASFSVDTFFFLSGLLVVLIYLRSLKQPPTSDEDPAAGYTKKETSNIFKTLWKIILYVAYRFCRLTPVYLFIVIFAELSMK